MNSKYTLQINVKLTATSNHKEHPKNISKMAESAWASMGHFLHHIDPETRKITGRLESLL